MSDMETIPIKNPAPLKRISELRASDERARIVGTVVNPRDSEFVLDDGSGQINVVLEDPTIASGVKTGSVVRVLGSPMEVEGGLEFHAEILQQLSGLDLKLHERVREEWKRLEEEMGVG